MSNSLEPHGLYSPLNPPGQNTGMGSCSLLQGIFPTQGSNPGFPYCRQILYQLSHQGREALRHSSVKFSRSVVSNPVTIPWTAARQASLACFTNSRSLLKLTSIKSVMPSNHLILCHPLLLLPAVFPSIRVFSSESVLLIRWPKYWNFSFNISPSNEYSGLISFRMDWLDLLAVQGTLKRLLQDRSSKASILQHSAFFIVQLSHPYWKNHSLD